MPITQYNSSVRQMSQSKFNSMKNASGKIPDLANQIVMTNSEDSNVSCLRTEVVYDMSSSDTSLNWGYPNGIQGNVEITKDLNKYQYLDFVLTIYPVNSMNTGGWSGVYRLDLTTKKSGDNWCVAGYSSAYADWQAGIGNVNAETWNFVLYYNIVDKKLKWFIRFTNTSWNNNADCVISKIYGVLKTPSMIYTGDELIAGNGITINNGTINASSMTTLWTNPNPTNAFPAQTITLNSDDYDYLIIRCTVRRPYNNERDPMWQTYMIKKGDIGFSMFVLTTSNNSDYRGEMMDRAANNITPTSIHFENASYMQNSTTNAVNIDYVMIPQQVIGVKVV